MQAPGADSEESASEVSTSRAASSNNPTARSTGPTARLEAVAESENLLASHEDGGITRLDSEAPRTWRLVEDNDATEELEGETDASVHGPGDPPPWEMWSQRWTRESLVQLVQKPTLMPWPLVGHPPRRV